MPKPKVKNEKTAASKAKGRRRSRVERRQVAVELALFQGLVLDEIADRRAERQCETHVPEQRQYYVDAEEGIFHENRFGRLKAEGHQQRVEQAEKGEGRGQQAEVANARIALAEQARNHQGHDQRSDDYQHIGEESLAGKRKVQHDADRVYGQPQLQALAPQRVPSHSCARESALETAARQPSRTPRR